MKVELPELKRCCFCIPLRYGLIAWGYIKLMLTLLFMSFIITALVRYSYSQIRRIRPDIYVLEVSVLSVLLCFMILDIAFTIVFLIGGHRKTAKLLHIYNIYSIVILVIYTLLYMWTTGNDLYYMSIIAKYMPDAHIMIISIMKAKMMLGFVFIGLQMYIIILTRNEINKLRNNTKFRFSNTNAGQSTLDIGTNDQGTAHQAEGMDYHRIGNDNQFLGIINQAGDAYQEPFRYNKF